jgi:hypothetical protein
VALPPFMHQNKGDEELHENPDVDPNGSDLHDSICGGQTELQ